MFNEGPQEEGTEQAFGFPESIRGERAVGPLQGPWRGRSDGSKRGGGVWTTSMGREECWAVQESKKQGSFVDQAVNKAAAGRLQECWEPGPNPKSSPSSSLFEDKGPRDLNSRTVQKPGRRPQGRGKTIDEGGPSCERRGRRDRAGPPFDTSITEEACTHVSRERKGAGGGQRADQVPPQGELQ